MHSSLKWLSGNGTTMVVFFSFWFKGFFQLLVQEFLFLLVLHAYIHTQALYALLLNGQGDQDIFFSVKGTLWGNCKFLHVLLQEFFKGTKARRQMPTLPLWSIGPAYCYIVHGVWVMCVCCSMTMPIALFCWTRRLNKRTAQKQIIKLYFFTAFWQTRLFSRMNEWTIHLLFCLLIKERTPPPKHIQPTDVVPSLQGIWVV